MTIYTAGEAIEQLQRMYGNALDEQLVITWWDSTDFENRDLDKAFTVCEDALEVSIGHVNDIVDAFAPALSEGEN
jgi:hypothetical protein